MDPIDFGGQSLNLKVTIDIYGNKLVNGIATKLLYFFIKFGGDVFHGDRDGPYRVWRSKVNVTMDIYGNKLVNTIATKQLCAS